MFIKMKLGSKEIYAQENNPLLFSGLGKSNNVEVRIRQPVDEDQVYETNTCGIVFEVILKSEGSSGVKDCFIELENRKKAVDAVRIEKGAAVDPDFYAMESEVSCCLSSLSEEVRSFVFSSIGECVDVVNDLLNYMCWRKSFIQDSRLFRIGRNQWSADGDNWYWIPADAVISGYHISGVYLTEEDRVEIESSLQDHAHAPLSHQLWSDAWHQQYRNPHIALVTAVSALEATVKSLILHNVSGSVWLVQNMPSPPVVKLLEEYAPEVMKVPDKISVFDRVTTAKYDLNLPKGIRKAIDERNKLVHGVSRSVELDIRSLLLSVRDVLYWCDYKCGHSWALEWIRPEVKQALQSKEKEMKLVWADQECFSVSWVMCSSRRLSIYWHTHRSKYDATPRATDARKPKFERGRRALLAGREFVGPRRCVEQ